MSAKRGLVRNLAALTLALPILGACGGAPATPIGSVSSTASPTVAAVTTGPTNTLSPTASATATTAPLPSTPPPSDTATFIAAGSVDTCAIISGGVVKCWGSNSYGELGNGSTDHFSHSIPVAVGLTDGAIALVAGWSYACATTSVGGLKCWGNNQYGQLGTGSTTDSSNPIAVVGLESGITAIAAGELHTCALTGGGGVKCWGDNREGDLGNDSTMNSLTPVDVVGLASGVTALAVGQTHTCALTKDGGVKCWGGNYTGALGHELDLDNPYSSRPVDVPGLAGATAIAAGETHTCALTSAGGVKCWGNDYAGQLGDGSTAGTSATPVDVIGLTSGVVAISANNAQTCALTSNGAVECWGENNLGQLGDGSTTDSAVPVGVVGLTSGVTAIAAGAGHTCALLETGAAKCWGQNVGGQLGDGSVTNSNSPVDVAFNTAGP